MKLGFRKLAEGIRGGVVFVLSFRAGWNKINLEVKWK